MLQRLGEAEGSPWHIRAEIIGWKEKFNSLLKKVGGGLGLLMRLSQVLVVSKENKKALGVLFRPMVAKKGVGLDRGLVTRSVH